MTAHPLSSLRVGLRDHDAQGDADWEDVSPRYPCYVCGAGAGCRRQTGNAFVSCAHRQSEWPLTNGAWLHRMRALSQ
ncbi:MAG: hypothetical protein ABSE49_07655 [Polyangiaceae bacterium]